MDCSWESNASLTDMADLMSLNEFIVEDVALIMAAATLSRTLPQGETWTLAYAVGHGPHQSRTLATLRDTLLPKLLSGEITPDH